MTVFDRIENFLALWRLAVPHLPEPTPAAVIHWCRYPDSAVEQAILRTGQKFAQPRIEPDFAPDKAYRYVTGTARVMATREGLAQLNAKTNGEIR
jgi:hypothetical protein